MSSYTLSATLEQPYDDAVEAVRAALSEEGFGILTEIDLSGTLREKLGVEVPRQVILGACRPPLAYEAIQADPSIAAVLPCNVVVRADDEATTVVEAFDPAAMMSLADDPQLRTVADDAKERIEKALASLTSGAG